MGAELVWNVAYVGAISLRIQEWGLVSAGVSFWVAYVIYYGVLAKITARLIGFKTARRNWLAILLLLIGSGLIMFLAVEFKEASFRAGVVTVLVAAVYSLRRMDSLVDLRGWLRQTVNRRAQ